MAGRRWIGGILALLLVLVVAALGVLVVFPALRRAPGPRTEAVPAPPPAAKAGAAPATPALPATPPVAEAAANGQGTLRVDARWGKAAGELGHKLGEESAPEGPMSLAVGRKGDLWVLDQVNGRVQHFDAKGKPVGSVAVAETTQDIALGPRGELYTLDRLGKSEVVAYDAAGRPT